MRPKGRTNMYAWPIWEVHIHYYGLLSSHLFIISLFELIMLLHPETQTHHMAEYLPRYPTVCIGQQLRSTHASRRQPIRQEI